MFIEAWSQKFKSDKYPVEFYFYYLEQIQYAKTPEILGESIIALLHWKDGKVRKCSNGDVLVGTEKYSLSQTKPNTYGETKHKKIFTSIQFYLWAQKVISQNSFDVNKVSDLVKVFHLYSEDSVVIPTFIVHVLSPLIYPLYDQHVDRAKRVFLAEDFHFNTSDLNILSYQEYQQFFNRILKDYPNPSIKDVKKIDNALWSFGKWMKINTAENNLQPKRIVQSSINPGLTEEIRKYIRTTLHKSKEEGKEFVDVKSGDIHKQMGLQNRMPAVCNAMESLGVFTFAILQDTPSGKSSTKVIRYCLNG